MFRTILKRSLGWVMNRKGYIPARLRCAVFDSKSLELWVSTIISQLFHFHQSLLCNRKYGFSWISITTSSSKTSGRVPCYVYTYIFLIHTRARLTVSVSSEASSNVIHARVYNLDSWTWYLLPGIFNSECSRSASLVDFLGCFCLDVKIPLSFRIVYHLLESKEV